MHVTIVVNISQIFPSLSLVILSTAAFTFTVAISNTYSPLHFSMDSCLSE